VIIGFLLSSHSALQFTPLRRLVLEEVLATPPIIWKKDKIRESERDGRVWGIHGSKRSREMLAQHCRPRGARYRLRISLQPETSLRAADHRAARREAALTKACLFRLVLRRKLN
jgi:hypothetical protein